MLSVYTLGKVYIYTRVRFHNFTSVNNLLAIENPLKLTSRYPINFRKRQPNHCFLYIQQKFILLPKHGLYGVKIKSADG